MKSLMLGITAFAAVSSAGIAHASSASDVIGGIIATVTGDFAQGPGNASDFAISSSVRGYVVGFYGLTWANFPQRAYDGFNVYTDSRIIDREKMSGSSAPDHTYCYDYSMLDLFFWTGWAAGHGYFSVDDFGAALVDDSGWSTYDAVWSAAEDNMAYIPLDETFAQSIKNALCGAEKMMMFGVCFENYNWYGEFYDLIAHAVVCCGYAYDTTKQPTDPAYLKGLFIIDPDNDRENKGGGTGAPNTITYCPVSWSSSKGYYRIKNVFRTEGYLHPDDYAIVVGSKNAVSPRISIDGKCDDVGGSDLAKALYAKARTDKSYFINWNDGTTEGLVTTKFSKMNKKGQVKFMVTLTPFFGKAQSVTKIVTPDSEGRIDTYITIPSFGQFRFQVGEDEEAAGEVTWGLGEFDAGSSDNPYFSMKLNVPLGGSFEGDKLYFGIMDPEDLPTFGDRDVIAPALPVEYAFDVTGGTSWSFRSRPKMGFLRDDSLLSSDKVVEHYESGWNLVVRGSETADNYSGLNLKYKASTGVFQGTFSVYYTNANYTNGKPKVKTAKVTVRGIAIAESGIGSGLASVTLNKKTYTWPVYVCTPESFWGYDSGDDWDDDYDDWDL